MRRAEPLRLDFPFTRHDSPELRARIHRDLDAVWRRVQEADPVAEALVLTGGFSRGEGSARGARPLNDYDLVVVRASAWPRASARYARLAETLADHVGLAVDLAPVARQRLPLLRPKVFWFDARHGGRVVAGPADVLDRVPAWAPRAIPPAEAARLLANRAVGLLDAVPAPGARADASLARLQAAKAFLAVAEAELVLEGRYAPTVTARAERFAALAAARSDLADAARGVAWATEWKLAPDGPANDADAAERWAAARAAVLDAARRVLPRAGWGALTRYPDGARESLEELAVAAFQRRALPPRRASHLVRALGFQLLDMASWPHGAKLPPPTAGRAARAFGEAPPAEWEDARRLLGALRGVTLQ